MITNLKKTKINLQTLNDKQKVWLTQLPYLSITIDGQKQIKKNSIKISNIYNYLDNPNAQVYGNIFGNKNEEFSKTIADTYIGKKDYMITKKQLLQELRKVGLGNLKITNISNDPSTGFQAIVFKDSFKNTGISYRGSDCEWNQGGLKDWALADVGEFLTNDSKQIHQAIDFFDQNKTKNNFIYGHSLGGNLVAHTYLQKHNEIKEAFSYNGLPVHQSLLDSEEKVNAFNNAKFTCTVVGGDIFQHIKEDNLYADKVIFIKNNHKAKPSWLSAHLPQANSYDENGNFIKISRQEAWKEMGLQRQAVASIAKNINNIFGDISYRQQLDKKQN